MVDMSDVLIVGAGTAGIYFGSLMAKKSHSVTIIERDPREKIGERLEIFHIDSIRFEQFGIHPPNEGTRELISIWEEGKAHSPDGTMSKTIKYGFHVMRFPEFIQRMITLAELDGVKFIFKCKFIDVLFENGKMTGVIAEKGGKKIKLRARIIIDASGTSAVVRTNLPPEHGVETFKLGQDDVLYVVLRYIRWKNVNDPHPTGLNLWPLQKVFCNPSHDPNGAILGIGQPKSFDTSEIVLKEFLESSNFPPFEVDKIERGITPYRRPPYSLVGDSFICIGDSACITKPFSGEGVTASWTLCKIAAEVANEALKNDGYITRDLLWEINVQYFRDQGAKFAENFAQLPGAANITANEMNYLFRKDIIFGEKELVELNRDFEMKLSKGKTLKIFGNMLWGLLSRNFSRKNLFGLIGSLGIAGKIRKHYEKFPEDITQFDTWVKKASKLWRKVGLTP
ncbi:MAG: NAD(P)/FAD-dependent oxidoreductase [Candidatus Helarchaeota archaeon]